MVLAIWMRRTAIGSAAIAAAALIGVGLLLYPKLSNLSSEYGAARVIESVIQYVRQNHGKWPQSAESLSRQWADGVVIDFTLTSEQLMDRPELLRRAIRSQSGKFYTYPHYEEDLNRLLQALQDSYRVSEKQTLPLALREIVPSQPPAK